MGSFSLEQTYFLVQTAAGVAVVASLVYLAMQLKQNTRAIRLSTVESVIRQFREHEALVCQSGDVAAILWQGLQDPGELHGADRMRFYQLCNYYLKSFENAYFQFREGALRSENWKGLKQYFVDIGSLPGLRKYWEDRQHWCSDAFREFMEREIMSANAYQGYELAGGYRQSSEPGRSE